MDNEFKNANKFEQAYWSLLSRTGSNENIRARARRELAKFSDEHEVFVLECFDDSGYEFISRKAAEIYKKKSGRDMEIEIIQDMYHNNIHWDDPILIDIIKELRHESLGSDASQISIYRVKGKYDIEERPSNDMGCDAYFYLKAFKSKRICCFYKKR